MLIVFIALAYFIGMLSAAAVLGWLDIDNELVLPGVLFWPLIPPVALLVVGYDWGRYGRFSR